MAHSSVSTCLNNIVSVPYLLEPAAWVIEGPAAEAFAKRLAKHIRDLGGVSQIYVPSFGQQPRPVFMGSARRGLDATDRLAAVKSSVYRADRVVLASDAHHGTITYGHGASPIALTLPAASPTTPALTGARQPVGSFPGLPPAWRGTGGLRT